MNETSKASRRRCQDPVYASHYFVGDGIDIGAGIDSLANHIDKFPQIKSIRNWDISDGDAQYLSALPDNSFDFVYSSHCLEHMHDPHIALQNWVRVLKPGGYLIASIPDEDMYEHGVWPSIFNSDHKWSFRLQGLNQKLPKTIEIFDLISKAFPIVSCERVIKLLDGYNPDFPSNVDQTLGEAECAIEFVLKKQIIKAHDMHLEICQEMELQGDYQRAINLYVQAISQNPDLFDAYNRLANLLTRKGLINDAENLWNLCVEKLSHLHIAHIYRALFLISIGKYDLGFQLRDPLVADERRSPISPPSNYPRWQGEDLKDKSIVIWTEFGYGDEIMFARFAHLFKKQYGASTVSIVCQKALLALFKTIEDVDLVFADEDISQITKHDYWVYPHSIPVYHSLEKNGIPTPIPYLKCSPKTSKKKVPKLQPRTSNRIRVGFTYRGNPTHENDGFRSIFDLTPFRKLFNLPGIDWIDLQKDVPNGGLKDMGVDEAVSLIHLGDELNDFMQTAEICTQLDLLICVDTSIAHLAGALGTPVWVMLPTFTDWRWGSNNTKTPWYPSMRIFRQEYLGNWNTVAQDLHAALCEKLRTKYFEAKKSASN